MDATRVQLLEYLASFRRAGRPSGRVVKFSTFRSAASPPIRKFRGGESCSPVSAFSPDYYHHRRTMNRATLFTSGFTRRRSRLFPGENRAVSSFHDPPSAPPPCCKTIVKYAPCSELTIPAVTIYEVTRVYEETRGEWGKRWNWKCFLSNVSTDSDPRIDWIGELSWKYVRMHRFFFFFFNNSNY